MSELSHAGTRRRSKRATWLWASWRRRQRWTSSDIRWA